MTAAVKYGLLMRLRHGVYCRSTDWQSKLPWEQDLLRIRAHVQATRGAATYSHVSAARLHGLRVWNAGRQIHVTVRSSLSATSTVEGVVAHRRDLPASSIVSFRRQGLGIVRATILEQTVIDCARTESFVSAVIIGDSALHRGASLDLMAELLDSLKGRRGVRAARRVLAALDKDSESAGETRTRLIVAAMDVPQPQYQVKLHVRGREYRVDGAWRDIKLALEFDGRTKYFDFEPTDEAIFAERLRERELMEDGWNFIRVVWADLARPEELKRRILAAMANAQRRKIS